MVPRDLQAPPRPSAGDASRSPGKSPRRPGLRNPAREVRASGGPSPLQGEREMPLWAPPVRLCPSQPPARSLQPEKRARRRGGTALLGVARLRGAAGTGGHRGVHRPGSQGLAILQNPGAAQGLLFLAPGMQDPNAPGPARPATPWALALPTAANASGGVARVVAALPASGASRAAAGGRPLPSALRLQRRTSGEFCRKLMGSSEERCLCPAHRLAGTLL